MSKSIWVVAAGTGGHIFPGLTLVEELKRQDPSLEFLFFGTHNRLEARLVPAHHHRIFFLQASPWKGKGLVARLSGLGDLAVGMLQVLMLLLKGRPRALISIGGYVSVPVALPCILFRVPFFIHEPNICSGMANRWLSYFARKAFTAPGSDALKKLKCEVHDAGNPVRSDIKAVTLRSEAKKILVLGGSQGALSLCRASLEALREMKHAGFKGELMLQSGEKNFEQSLEWQKEFEVDDVSTVVPFINKVSQALQDHDVVVARAGAMTLAELSIAGLPTILVPFPYAADDHQRVNARLLQESGAALVADEMDSGFLEKLTDQMRSLAIGDSNFEKRKSLNQELLKWARPDAARDIAQKILASLI